MPLRWASCLFRPARGPATSFEVNGSACPAELQEQLSSRGTACLRPRGAHIIYERVDDAGQGAFTPPVVIYIKRLPVCGGLEVCIKRTQVTHFVGRAAREARLQVQLQHPHLLPALASVRGRHHYYLVLPAAEGDLWAEAEAMRQQGTGYTEGELREVARQILMGLEHLHASGLAHRDIKPANVLRLSDGRVAVADFGCADGCTAGFVAAGTTQFQPPECRRNAGAQLAVLPKGYDQRVQDMWSLGATLASLWFAVLPEVIRGAGTSRVSSAAAAAAAVAAAAAAAAGGGGATATADDHGSSNAGSGSDAVRTSDGPPPQSQSQPAAAAALPRFLAAAGFAPCASTVGACGVSMSEPLLDLLSRLLRMRPSERLTASQALQHEWLGQVAGGAGRGGGCQAPCEVSTAAAVTGGEETTGIACANPVVMAAVAAAAAAAAPGLPTSISGPPSPLNRGYMSVTGRLMPFASHQQLMSVREVPTATTMAPAASPAAPAAQAADGRAGALDDGSEPPQLQEPAQPHHQLQQHQHGRCSPASSGSTSSTCPVTPSKPSPQQQPDAPPQSCRKGALSCSSQGHGHSLSQEGGSPVSATSRSPGEEAQQLALRQQQQQQQRQQPSSSSSWLLRPSAQGQTPKRAQRAILRVFVGAGGESSGSN